MFKWIEKKDLVYWLIIILVIWVLNTRYDTTLTQWAFAGTIISIILAVLAIIYSFSQSSTTLYSTKKLEESAEKIENITTQLENTSINELFSKLEKKIESIDSNLDDKLKQNFTSYISEIEKRIAPKVTSPSTDYKIFNKDQWLKYIKENLDLFQGDVLCISYFSIKQQKEIDLDKWIKLFISEQTDGEDVISKNLVWALFIGAITVYSTLGVLDFSIKDSNIIICSNLESEFELAMDKIVEEYSDHSRVKNSLAFISSSN